MAKLFAAGNHMYLCYHQPAYVLIGWFGVKNVSRVVNLRIDRSEDNLLLLLVINNKLITYAAFYLEMHH